MHASASTAPTAADPPRLALLGGFYLQVGNRPVALTSNAQRVLAILSVGPRVGIPQPRTVLAERLWIDSPTPRAQGNLRTALWRIRQADRRLLAGDHDQVGLGPGVRVDVHDSLAQAERLLSGTGDVAAEDVRVGPLTQDLLPGWEEDWLLLERERIRQIHLHALEALSSRLLACGAYGRAIEAAFAAVSCEPLRESAHCTLIKAHLAEGNLVEAHRHYRHFAQLLWQELRLAPAHTFDQLAAGRLTRTPSTR